MKCGLERQKSQMRQRFHNQLNGLCSRPSRGLFLTITISLIDMYSDSPAASCLNPHLSYRSGVAQPPGSSDQRGLQRPDSAPGAGAGAGQAVCRNPALHSAL